MKLTLKSFDTHEFSHNLSLIHLMCVSMTNLNSLTQLHIWMIIIKIFATKVLIYSNLDKSLIN